MGNCTKVPRTNSDSAIRANRPPPPPPSRPSLGPNPYPPSSYAISNVGSQYNLPLNRNLAQLVQSGYNHPAAYNRPAQANYPQPNIHSIPLNSPPVPRQVPMNEPNRAITRFARIIDHSEVLVDAGSHEYWINFQYSSSYESTVTISCFARERFHKQNNTYYFDVDPHSFPKPQTFKVGTGKDVEFANKYKIGLNGIPDNVLEISDRCTYPIIIEINTKGENNQNQLLITYYKIHKEHESYHPVMVKKTIKVDQNYFPLFDLYGTSNDSEESECLICLVDFKTVAAIPCRHVCYCEACVVEVKKKNNLICPLCRKEITSFLNVKHKN
jgi:E3 ubiquitin-protein ligase MGRN1